MDDTNAPETQGNLQLGPSQVPKTRRAHRPRPQSKKRTIDLPLNPTEGELHQSVAELLDWILIEPTIYTTFPAGWGKLTKGTAGRLYASGLKRGMPDILVFDRNSKTIGIELKTGHNSVSSAQRAMFAKLYAVGIRVYICRTVAEVLTALADADIAYRKITTFGV